MCSTVVKHWHEGVCHVYLHSHPGQADSQHTTGTEITLCTHMCRLCNPFAHGLCSDAVVSMNTEMCLHFGPCCLWGNRRNSDTATHCVSRGFRRVSSVHQISPSKCPWVLWRWALWFFSMFKDNTLRVYGWHVMLVDWSVLYYLAPLLQLLKWAGL